jgi:hypothetical protein
MGHEHASLLQQDEPQLQLCRRVLLGLGGEVSAAAQQPRSYQGLLEVSHFHLFAMGMLLLVLTHLMLFVPVRNGVKAWLIALPFAAALLNEGASWLVRFGHPLFAYLKIGGFLLLQGSLAVLIVISLWASFRGSSNNYREESLLQD